ncbi:hypothetical protein FDA25_18075 [Clostridium botulinum]|nr:hypothetical protein [Clostridium botulinum]NFH74430.1 hypothetical protein [Clostridium botulinum]NFJ73835.1 hypothetical protein [Clostridium botulinum]NFN61281.1 hypothetical protein [Clostridium botulinum]
MCEIDLTEYDNKCIENILKKHVGKTLINEDGIQGKKYNDGIRRFGVKWDFVKMFYDKKFLEGFFDEIRIDILNLIFKNLICYGNNCFKDLAEKEKITKEYIEQISNDVFFRQWIINNNQALT